MRPIWQEWYLRAKALHLRRKYLGVYPCHALNERLSEMKPQVS